jgi:hypothetical protein
MRLRGKMKDKPYAANRYLAVISSLWNWAAERAGYRRLSPCTSLGGGAAAIFADVR